jgi:hypothetical protein
MRPAILGSDQRRRMDLDDLLRFLAVDPVGSIRVHA